MYRVKNTKMDVMKNMKVIEFVKKNPSIYDRKQRHTNDRLSVDQCWADFATEINESVSEAKQRWRNVKDGYYKYLKNAFDKNGVHRPRRPYYLAKYLGFLKPQHQKLARWSPLPELESDILPISDLSESEPLDDTVELPDPIIIKGESVNDLELRIEQVNLDANVSDHEEVEEPNLAHFSKSDVKFGQSSSDLTDPNMAFLYSVLPDMRTMNDKQKRRFKIGTLKLISDILGDDF